MFAITFGGMLNSLIIEAMMTEELGILAGDDGYGQTGRHLLQGHPCVAPLELIIARQLLITADKHQRRHIDGYETQGYN